MNGDRGKNVICLIAMAVVVLLEQLVLQLKPSSLIQIRLVKIRC